MHVRYCHCDACLPGVPAQPTRVTFTGRRRWASKQERRRHENAQTYQRRKAREAGA